MYNRTTEYLETLRPRFEEKFERGEGDGCWEWKASRDRCGYGMVRSGKTTIGAHRLAWYFTNGAYSEELNVLHKCDNPCCVNPEHLFLGTRKDNMQDMQRKGRGVQLKGRFHANTVLTDELVAKIKACDKHYLEVAKEFGISVNSVYRALKR